MVVVPASGGVDECEGVLGGGRAGGQPVQGGPVALDLLGVGGPVVAVERGDQDTVAEQGEPGDPGGEVRSGESQDAQVQSGQR